MEQITINGTTYTMSDKTFADVCEGAEIDAARKRAREMIGQRFYFAKDHWTVIDTTTENGKPAVVISKDGRTRKARRGAWNPVVPLDKFERYARPSGS